MDALSRCSPGLAEMATLPLQRFEAADHAPCRAFHDTRTLAKPFHSGAGASPTIVTAAVPASFGLRTSWAALSCI